jgi:hypothetical protein
MVVFNTSLTFYTTFLAGEIFNANDDINSLEKDPAKQLLYLTVHDKSSRVKKRPI